MPRVPYNRYLRNKDLDIPERSRIRQSRADLDSTNLTADDDVSDPPVWDVLTCISSTNESDAESTQSYNKDDFLMMM